MEALLLALFVAIAVLYLSWRGVRALERGGHAPELDRLGERLALLEEATTSAATHLAQLEEQQRFTERLLEPPPPAVSSSSSPHAASGAAMSSKTARAVVGLVRGNVPPSGCEVPGTPTS